MKFVNLQFTDFLINLDNVKTIAFDYRSIWIDEKEIAYGHKDGRDGDDRAKSAFAKLCCDIGKLQGASIE